MQKWKCPPPSPRPHLSFLSCHASFSLWYPLPASSICNYGMTITQAAELCCLWLWSEGFKEPHHWGLLPELFPIVLQTKALKVKWRDYSPELLKGHFPPCALNPMIPSVALNPDNVPQLGELTALFQPEGLNTVSTTEIPSFRHSHVKTWWLWKCTMYCFG